MMPSFHVLPLFNVATFTVLIMAGAQLYRTRMVLGKRAALLFAFVAAEVAVITFAMFCASDPVWFERIAAAGRILEVGGVVWFLAWLTRLNGTE